MKKEVVITGIGVLSPIGIDSESYWTALCAGLSGVKLLSCIDPRDGFKAMASELPDFRAKDYVEPRKNIKVMSRDIQIGVVAAAHAVRDAALITKGDGRNVDPDRFGVLFGSDLIAIEIDEVLDAVRAGTDANGDYDFHTWGAAAMEKIMPLWMLKYLPNMPASHIAIAHDARGPSNTPTLCRGSGMAAIFEAARVIERGAADVMLCGSCGNHVNPVMVARSRLTPMAPLCDDPSSIPRPFDKDRNGTVIGEGGAAFVLESREFAEARGATPYAFIRGFANTMESKVQGAQITGAAMRNAIRNSMKEANISVNDLSHINAEGIAGIQEDRLEAMVIRDTLGDLPVTTQKGNFGELGSGSSSVEFAATLLSLKHGKVPPIRNHEKTADDCPINAVFGKPLDSGKKFALKLNQTKTGNSFAIVVQKW